VKDFSCSSHNSILWTAGNLVEGVDSLQSIVDSRNSKVKAGQKIFSLDDALHDSVTNSGFSVVATDRVTVELWFSKTTRTVLLSTLVPKK
jgi:hypothetical protein